MIYKTLVSVIVPVYNVENYLSKSFDSIVNQTYKDIEIIVINDGSTDSSGKIADKYAEKFSNFKVYHTENRGLSEARNYGLEKSKGEYIFFLDPDDWIEKELFELAITKMNQDETNIFLMNFNFVNDQGRYISKNRNVRTNTSAVCSTEIVMKEILLNHIQCFVWQFVVRRSLLINRSICHNFKNIMYEDVIWTPKTLQLAKSISISEKYFYNYRQRKHSIVHVSTIKSIRDRKFGIENFSDFIKKCYPQFEIYLGIWRLAALIHLYAMCASIKNPHNEIEQLQKNVRKQIQLNKNINNLKATDKIKYFLIISQLFVPITNTVRKIKNFKFE
ncbi:glycosyltransferase family 2 protein [Leuconostoc citreum]|uniref:glycosyltransferase family 2 protein n=1 Tax=Leuconostoc citreum TaxID=33964 RepID=UPI00216595C7|nr:glycosyltransferase [Leuconostoc citreum]UVW16006.1 glycosyltransferase [Leuconostoc citreum]